MQMTAMLFQHQIRSKNMYKEEYYSHTNNRLLTIPLPSTVNYFVLNMRTELPTAIASPCCNTRRVVRTPLTTVPIVVP